MATLPVDDLTRQLPALQPQLFNVTRPGTMQTNPTLPRNPADPMPYGEQMSNVGNAFLNAITGAARFAVSAPGGPGLADLFTRSPAAPAATPAAAVPSATIRAGQLESAPAPAGQPGRAAALVNPASTAAEPAAAGRAPRASTGGAAPRTAAADPAAAAALVPGVTGYYLNNQLVPYGVTPEQLAGAAAATGSRAGAPGAPAAGGPSAAGGGIDARMAQLIDPRGYFPDVVGQQLEYARNAASDILSRAGNGSQLGYSARLRALASVYLNGLAGVGTSGANQFNSSAASLLNQDVASATQQYVSDNALTGDLARANATVGAARASARPYAEQMQLERDKPVPIGTTIETDANGQSIQRVTYGIRGTNGGMPRAIQNEAQPRPREGAKQTYNGVDYTYRQGKWEAQ